MANTINGKILVIGQTENIPYRDKVFSKRELVLDATRFDAMTGQPFENYPKFEFVGRHVSDLDGFQVGQAVIVSFVLSGRKRQKDGMDIYITSVQGYKIEPLQRLADQPQQQQGGYSQPSVSQYPQQPQAPAQQPVMQPQWNGQPQTENNLPF